MSKLLIKWLLTIKNSKNVILGKVSQSIKLIEL